MVRGPGENDLAGLLAPARGQHDHRGTRRSNGTSGPSRPRPQAPCPFTRRRAWGRGAWGGNRASTRSGGRFADDDGTGEDEPARSAGDGGDRRRRIRRAPRAQSRRNPAGLRTPARELAAARYPAGRTTAERLRGNRRLTARAGTLTSENRSVADRCDLEAAPCGIGPPEPVRCGPAAAALSPIRQRPRPAPSRSRRSVAADARSRDGPRVGPRSATPGASVRSVKNPASASSRRTSSRIV